MHWCLVKTLSHKVHVVADIDQVKLVPHVKLYRLLCARVLWPMPAWVWRDVRSGVFFVKLSDCTAIAHAVADKLLRLLPYVVMSYQQRSPLDGRREDGSHEVQWSEEGVWQGNPMGLLRCSASVCSASICGGTPTWTHHPCSLGVRNNRSSVVCCVCAESGCV